MMNTESSPEPFRPNVAATTLPLSVSKDEFLARCAEAFDKGQTVTISWSVN